ncbi:MAG: PBP1A family penicillin-binding protein [Candidatus Tectomicrobia bacterium]|uniref:PBP1A family penicillin-binding protein n=1 Tax=Tectimicrobiota bacterium TaxID=2528274 RepID=A0A932I5I1_UNCTE|nr:PBP1A family penicillin-binding protein [Candidatus Tectomicrobia bacterium]
MPGKRRPSSAYAFFVGSTLRKKVSRVVRLAWTAFVLFGLPLIGAFAVLVWVSDDIPRSAAILDHRPSLTTFVHDAGGRLVGSFAAEQRKLLPLAEISPAMRHAAVSVEDERFYRHWGVDPWGILRAAVNNLRSGGISEGASTITQQLVRLLTLQREKSLKRKVVEAIAAVRLEMSLTKDQILERYLNQVYFGQGAYGVAAAARTYFNKEASELTVPEAALLAGLIQAPGRFRPFDNPGPALERRAHVLWRMEVAGYLKPGEGGRLARSPLELRAPEPIRVGGHFLEHVRRQLEEMYGSETLYRGGLRVHTTLRLDAQEAAENAVREGVRKLVERRWPQRSKEPGWRSPEAALLALDVRSGAIRAMAGGTDFGQSKFNRTVQALRQPGSSFKPIVYAAAVDMGFTPVDSVLDAPIVMEGGGGGLWKPENYSRNFSGRLSLREALAESRNTASIRLVGALGMGRLIRFARSLGIRSEISPTLSSALGASAVTLQEMVSAYSVFASGGIHRTPYAIERIEDGEGRVIYRHEDRPEPAIRPEVAYVLTHMLKTVVEAGTARGAAVLGRPLAGKTGTTNEFRDNWFIGFTPDLAAGVWVGFDLPQPLGPGETGGRNAVPIFVDFFRASGLEAPMRDFIPPPGVEFVRVDKETGLLATRATRKTGFEVFVRGTAPTQYADAGQRGTDAFFREEGLPQRMAPASAR